MNGQVIWSGLKAVLYSAVASAFTLWQTGENPLAKDRWPLWVAPIVIGILKGGDKANTLKKASK